MKSRILHVDMDAFFPAVEQVLDPKLRGKPVVVGSFPEERGVVSSASYEARKFGVHSGMSSHEAGSLCPQAIFVHGNFAAYRKYSDIIRDIFLSFTDGISMISLDEAFLDMADCNLLFPDIRVAGQKIKETIRSRTGLTASVGIASSCVVAKVASDYQKPDGLTYVAPGREASFLGPLDIRDLPGIGPKSEKQLRTLGINKLADIQSRPQRFFVDRWGKYGFDLWEKVWGRDSRRPPDSRRQKSVSREVTFPVDTCDSKLLRETLAYLVEKSSYDLRCKNLQAKEVKIKIRYRDFATITGSKKLIIASDITSDLLQQAQYLFGKYYRSGEYVRLLGVGYSDFADNSRQTSVFDVLEKAQADRCGRLEKSVDKVRSRFGFKSLRVLSSFRRHRR